MRPVGSQLNKASVGRPLLGLPCLAPGLLGERGAARVEWWTESSTQIWLLVR